MTELLDSGHDDRSVSIDEAKAMTRTQRSYRRSLGIPVPFVAGKDVWPDERVAELRRWVALGLSGSQIAAQMGLSRCQVMGKAARCGLTVGGGRSAPTMTREARRAANRGRKAARRRAAAGHGSTPGPETEPHRAARAEPPADTWAPLPDTAPVALADLEPGMCRWPIGDDRPFRFCGCPAGRGFPYCAPHAVASIPPHRRESAMSSAQPKQGG
jgi:GcrA cell cycle regulator